MFVFFVENRLERGGHSGGKTTQRRILRTKVPLPFPELVTSFGLEIAVKIYPLRQSKCAIRCCLNHPFSTEKIDECLINNCENGGTCINAGDGFNCSCADGWTGVICEGSTNYN